MDKRTILFVVLLTITFYFVNQWLFPSPAPQKQTTQIESIETTRSEKAPAASPSSTVGEFYVLENEYQQIVFSSLGGSIAEINLPLHSKTNTSSIVLPTEFDRLFEKLNGKNDTFPAFAYAIDTGKGIEKRESGQKGGYYPLLRRTLFSKNSFRAPTPYYALNVSSATEDLSNVPFRMTLLTKDRISFSYSDSKRTIVKTFSFPANPQDAPYCLDVAITVDRGSDLFVTTGVPEVELISESPAPALSYCVTKANRKTVSEEISLPKECITSTAVAPNWVCNSNGFFGLILDPLQPLPAGYKACKVPGNQDPSRLSLIDPEYNPYPADNYPGYELQLPLANTNQFRFYAGPLQTDILRKIDTTYINIETGANPQYTLALSFHGWFTFISEPFAEFLFVLMRFFHAVTTSWGISILLLTLALRVMLYPLNAWSIKSTLKMQQIAPRVTAIQERNKKEPKKAQMEIMMLYKEAGVNPLSGCLPMLIQLPFLFGMLDLLKSSFELRGASFIPGWIDNLSAPDVLFSWHYSIPFLGNQFHLLPLLLGATMWAQQKFSASLPKDPSKMTDQQKQQKMMGNIMTIVFTVMFYNFPSGLNLYWLSSTLLGILQQWWMMRKLNAARDTNKRI